MFFRTDIAIEANNKINSDIDGVEVTNYKREGIEITKVKIKNKQAEEKLSKPVGDYITVDIPILTDNCKDFPLKASVVSNEMKAMIPDEGLVLVVGLGNSNITADNLGPMTVDSILATRHISLEVKKSIGLESLRSVAVLSPGVLGQTGIETAEILYALVNKILPSCVIVIDAFASSELRRLGTTVQISNSGISPGSGVLNSRARISKETMGVPVISIGVPTVVDTVSLLSEIMNKNKSTVERNVSDGVEHMIITPREIDLLIQRASKFLSITINTLLQPELSSDDIEILLS